MQINDSEIQIAFKLEYPQKNAKPFSLDARLSIPSKGVTAIFGPSGSGKTTLLRCMAGLEKTKHGSFKLGSTVWQSDTIYMPIHKRQQGVVFQEASLFSHLTVQGNLEYSRKRAQKRVNTAAENSQTDLIDYSQILRLLGIEGLLKQYPSSLSGGERQRVAIARALLCRPKILFMDEPLAALDFKLKREILPYLESLSRASHIPIVYITHSLEEVARLADHLVVMDQGRVVAQGALEDVLARVDLPIYLDNDLGVVLKTNIVEKDSQWHLMRVAFEGGFLWLKDNAANLSEEVRVRVLAKDVSLTLTPHDSSILNSLPAEVIEIVDDVDQAMALVRLKVGEHSLISKLTKRSVDHLSLSVGLNLWAQIKSVAILP